MKKFTWALTGLLALPCLADSLLTSQDLRRIKAHPELVEILRVKPSREFSMKYWRTQVAQDVEDGAVKREILDEVKTRTVKQGTKGKFTDVEGMRVSFDSTCLVEQCSYKFESNFNGTSFSLEYVPIIDGWEWGTRKGYNLKKLSDVKLVYEREKFFEVKNQKFKLGGSSKATDTFTRSELNEAMTKGYHRFICLAPDKKLILRRSLLTDRFEAWQDKTAKTPFLEKNTVFELGPRSKGQIIEVDDNSIRVRFENGKDSIAVNFYRDRNEAIYRLSYLGDNVSFVKAGRLGNRRSNSVYLTFNEDELHRLIESHETADGFKD